MFDLNKPNVSLALRFLCLASLMPRILGQIVVMSSHTEILITTLLCLVTNVVDWSPFGWNEQLKKVWELPIAEQTIRGAGSFGYSLKIVLSTIVLVRNFTAPLHLLCYVLTLYSILTWKRPGRILSICLIVGALKNILTNLVTTVAGILLCWTERCLRWRTGEFLVVQLTSMSPSIYLWRLVRHYSESCEHDGTQDRVSGRSHENNDSNIVDQRVRRLEPLEGSVVEMAKVYEDCQKISSISNIDGCPLDQAALDVGSDFKYSKSLATLLTMESLDSEDIGLPFIDDLGLTPAEKSMKILGLTRQDVANVRARINRLVSTSSLEEDPEDDVEDDVGALFSVVAETQEHRDVWVLVKPLRGGRILEDDRDQGNGYTLKTCSCFPSDSDDRYLGDDSGSVLLARNELEESEKLQRSVSKDCPVVSFDLSTLVRAFETTKRETRTSVDIPAGLKNAAVVLCYDFEATKSDDLRSDLRGRDEEVPKKLLEDCAKDERLYGVRRNFDDLVVEIEKALPVGLKATVDSLANHEERMMLSGLDDVTANDFACRMEMFGADVQTDTIDDYLDGSRVEDYPEEKRLSLRVGGAEQTSVIPEHEDGTKFGRRPVFSLEEKAVVTQISGSFEQQLNPDFYPEDYSKVITKAREVLSKIELSNFEQTARIEGETDKDSLTRNAKDSAVFEDPLKVIDESREAALPIGANLCYAIRQLESKSWVFLNSQLDSRLASQKFIDRNVFSRIVQSIFDTAQSSRDHVDRENGTRKNFNEVDRVALETNDLAEEPEMYESSTSRFVEKFENVDGGPSLNDWRNRYDTRDSKVSSYLIKDTGTQVDPEEYWAEQRIEGSSQVDSALDLISRGRLEDFRALKTNNLKSCTDRNFLQEVNVDSSEKLHKSNRSSGRGRLDEDSFTKRTYDDRGVKIFKGISYPTGTIDEEDRYSQASDRCNKYSEYFHRSRSNGPRYQFEVRRDRDELSSRGSMIGRDGFQTSKKLSHRRRRLDLEEKSNDKSRVPAKISADSTRWNSRMLKSDKSRIVDPNDWGTITSARAARSSGYENSSLMTPKKTVNRASEYADEILKTLPVSSARNRSEVDERGRSTSGSRSSKVRKHSESPEEREDREMRALRAYNEKTLLKYKREMEAKRQKVVSVEAQGETQRCVLSLDTSDVGTFDVDDKEGRRDRTFELEEKVASNVDRNVERYSTSVPIEPSTNRILTRQRTDPSNVPSENTAQCFFRVDGAVTLERMDTYSGNKLGQEPGRIETNPNEAIYRKQHSKYSRPRNADIEDVSSASCKTFEGLQKGRDLDRTPARENIRDQLLSSSLGRAYDGPSTNDGNILMRTIKSFTRRNSNSISTSSTDSDVPEESQPLLEILGSNEDIPRRIEDSEEYRQLRRRNLSINVREAIGRIDWTFCPQGPLVTEGSRIRQIDHSVQSTEQQVEFRDIVYDSTVDLLRRAFTFDPEDTERGFRLGPGATELYPIYDDTLVTIGEIIKAAALRGPVNEFASQPDMDVEMLVAEEGIVCGSHVAPNRYSFDFNTDHSVKIASSNEAPSSSIDQGLRGVGEMRQFGVKSLVDREESLPLVHIPGSADGFSNETEDPSESSSNSVDIAEERIPDIDCSNLLGNNCHFFEDRKISVPATKWHCDLLRVGTMKGTSVERTSLTLRDVVYEFFNLSRATPNAPRSFLVDKSAFRLNTASYVGVLEDVSVDGKSIQDLAKELTCWYPVGALSQTRHLKSFGSSTTRGPEEIVDKARSKMFDFKMEAISALHMIGTTPPRFVGSPESVDKFSEVSTSLESSMTASLEQTFSAEASVTNDLEKSIRRTVKISTASDEPPFTTSVNHEDVDLELEQMEEDSELSFLKSDELEGVPDVETLAISTLVEDHSLFSTTSSELIRRLEFRNKIITAIVLESISPECNLEDLSNSLVPQKGIQVDLQDLDVDGTLSLRLKHVESRRDTILDSDMLLKNNVRSERTFIGREDDDDDDDEKEESVINDTSRAAGCSKLSKKTKSDGYQSEIRNGASGIKSRSSETNDEVNETLTNDGVPCVKSSSMKSELEKLKNLMTIMTDCKVTGNCISVKSLNISDESEEVDEQGVFKDEKVIIKSEKSFDLTSYKLVRSVIKSTTSGYEKVSLLLAIEREDEEEIMLEIGKGKKYEGLFDERLERPPKAKTSEDTKKSKTPLTRFEYKIQRHLSRRGRGLSSGYLMDYDSDGMMISHPSTPTSIRRSTDAISTSKQNNIETIARTLKSSEAFPLSECIWSASIKTSRNSPSDKSFEEIMYDDLKTNLKKHSVEEKAVTHEAFYDFNETVKKMDETMTGSHSFDAIVDEEDDEVPTNSKGQQMIIRNKIAELLETLKSTSFDIIMNALKNLVFAYPEDDAEARSKVLEIVTLPQFTLLESLIDHLRSTSKVSTSTSTQPVLHDAGSAVTTLTRSSTELPDVRSNSEIFQDKQDRFKEVKEILSRLTDAILESLACYEESDSKLKNDERRSLDEHRASCHERSSGLSFENRTVLSGSEMSSSEKTISVKGNQSTLLTSSGFNVIPMTLSDLVRVQGRSDDVEEEMEENPTKTNKFDPESNLSRSYELLHCEEFSNLKSDQHDSIDSLSSMNTIEASNASGSAVSFDGHSFMEEFSNETLNSLESTSASLKSQYEQSEGLKHAKNEKPKKKKNLDEPSSS